MAQVRKLVFPVIDKDKRFYQSTEYYIDKGRL